MSPSKQASSFAEISLSALKENLRQVQIQSGNTPILAIVKANAYGHGAVPITRFLSQQKDKIKMFGVAFFEEGLALRSAGIRDPILILTGCIPEQIPDMIAEELTPVVFDVQTLETINAAAIKQKKSVKIHLKVDTGMGRLGIRPEAVQAFMLKVLSSPSLTLEGILSHFSEADLKDLSFAQKQLSRLQTILEDFADKGLKVPYCHVANSAGIFQLKSARLDCVRPGIMLYGYSPLQEAVPHKLTPIMQVKARIITLKTVPKGTPISYGRTFITKRKSRIATVAIGYADGYPLSLSNRGMMIAKGKLVPVTGRVCMDMCMLDVSDAPPLTTGDYVTVIGSEGSTSMWAEQVANLAKTHVYEILCGIGSRVERYYV